MTDERFVELFESLRVEMRGGFADLRGEMTDLRRHFDVTAEGLRYELGLVAEGSLGFRDQLTREIAELRDEMKREFVAVRAEIADLRKMILYTS